MKISIHRKLLLAAALAGLAGASPAFGQGTTTVTLVP
jgi:F0F1-type ATP synthase membrane subunit c/vacuolar-type H+-ATPase subunit K